MPELPEVETILRGLRPFCEGQKIKKVIVRHYGLRRPVPPNIASLLQHQIICSISRRAKYLLFKVGTGHLLVHLGMSGRLQLVAPAKRVQKHDHIDIHLTNKMALRFTDPRRFGLFLWAEGAIDSHPLLAPLGPEPFDRRFNGNYLWTCAQRRQVPIKSLLMDNKVVVGIGNIYAAESLFRAQISPLVCANTLSKDRLQRLVRAIKKTLGLALLQGGTTLKDFVNSNGAPGYFAHSLKVYGRAGSLCVNCETELKSIYIAQRNTVYCTHCQR